MWQCPLGEGDGRSHGRGTVGRVSRSCGWGAAGRVGDGEQGSLVRRGWARAPAAPHIHMGSEEAVFLEEQSQEPLESSLGLFIHSSSPCLLSTSCVSDTAGCRAAAVKGDDQVPVPRGACRTERVPAVCVSPGRTRGLAARQGALSLRSLSPRAPHAPFSPFAFRLFCKHFWAPAVCTCESVEAGVLSAECTGTELGYRVLLAQWHWACEQATP